MVDKPVANDRRIVICIGLAAKLLTERPTSPSSLKDTSFGKSEHHLVFRTANGKYFGTTQSIILANTPQLVVSLIYFWYNSVFTGMLSAAEYGSHGVQRKPLRVTSPVGVQKSTYWLSIPYRYAIPTCILFSVLHWLVSESVFYVPWVPYVPTSTNSAVSQYEDSISFGNVGPADLAGDDFGIDYSNSCGYSPRAVLGSVILLSSLALILLVFGLCRFKSSIPVTMSRSAAISAACHPPETDKNAAQKPVMWRKVDSESQVRDSIGTTDSTGTDTAFFGGRYTFTSLGDAD